MNKDETDQKMKILALRMIFYPSLKHISIFLIKMINRLISAQFWNKKQEILEKKTRSVIFSPT